MTMLGANAGREEQPDHDEGAVPSLDTQVTGLLAAAFRASTDAMILFRAADELIVDVNDVWCGVTGYRREEVIGRSQRELDIWGDPAQSAAFAARMRAEGAVRDFAISFQHRLPNGRPMEGRALLTAQPVTLDGVTYYLVVGHDITTQWRAEQQEQQRRRLEELGRLAGGVAHDFNNLLTVIQANAQFALDALAEGVPPDAADLREILATTGRAADLTRRLLAFSRQRAIMPECLELTRVVRDAGQLLRRVVSEQVGITFELADALPRVMADPSQVEQVLLNLAVNARDAMPEGGVLTIRTAAREVPASMESRLAEGEQAVSPGRYVLLSVQDTGVGMDPETQARVFEPFFTTKAPGRGTGLGLAVVYGIVRQAGGAIVVDSAPGQGTLIRVYWPEATPAALVEEDRRTSVAAAGGGARRAAARSRVLVVEDEESVRITVCRMLKEAGYRVVEARHGAEALAVLANTREPVDLVLADAVMPVMGGLRLRETLQRERPGLPVVLMSGYLDPESSGGGTTLAGVPVLEKPIERDALIARIEETLHRAAPAGPFRGGPG